jgi:hypothetical protein
MLTLFAVVALAACAQEIAWQKPGATGQELAQDTDGCRAQAYAAQGMTSDAQRLAIVYTSCMEGKGWRRAEKPKP